jgi:hypothetical protein
LKKPDILSMLKSIGVIFAALALTAGPAFAVTYSTSFALTENPISEGGKWVNGKADGLSWNNIATANGLSVATHRMLTAPPYDDCIAHLSKSFMTFGNDQYAQGTVHRVAGYQLGHEIELLLRFQITANNARGYEIYWSTNTGLYIVRWNGALNSFTPLYTVSPGLANDGDVVRAEASGSTITVKINGRVVLSGSDNTWTNGQPGIGLNPYDPNSDMAGYCWSDFTAGDLGGTSAQASAAMLTPDFCGDPEPNPANPRTVMRYGLALPGDVHITLHDVRGGFVATLKQGRSEAGIHEVLISAAGIPSGVYLVSASVGKVRKTARVLLLK